jgi:O-antigen/teichoic acid export membrane protein
MLSLAFHTSVATVLFPKAVSQSPDIVRALAGRAARLSTLLTTLAGLAVVGFGPQMLALLYGADYRGATPVLRILVLEVVLAGAALVLSQAFMALGRPGVITGLQIIGLLLTIPFMLLLVPRFGIVGAAVALFLSTTIRLIFVLASFPLFLNMRVPQILPTWTDVRFLAGTIWQHSGLLLKRQRLVLEQGD